MYQPHPHWFHWGKPPPSRDISWLLPMALARVPDCPCRLLHWLCIVATLATCPCICWSWEGLWLYRPLIYSPYATHTLSCLPRLHSCYIVAIHRFCWPIIWWGHSLLGHERGKTGLPLLTTTIWPLFWPCDRLYYLTGPIHHYLSLFFHSVCSLPFHLDGPIC